VSVDRADWFRDDAYRLTELDWALIRLEGKIPKGKDWQRTKPLRDPFQAAGRWAEWGKRWNMGVVLGPSGLCVLEYDSPEGERTLLELVGGEWPTTPTAWTGSGRRHLYYAAPPNGVVKAARDGLELRLGPHQCVVPPSEHPDTGRPYVWELGLEPWSTPLLKVPAAALAYFAEAGDVLRDRLQADPNAKVHPGQRREQVFRLACSLVARGVPPDAILTAARAFNVARCEPSLDDAQVVAQVDGAVERYPSGTSLSLLPRKRVPTSEPPEMALIEPRGVPPNFPGKQCDLGAILEAFGELLVMPDAGAVEIALSAVVANYAPGDCVWPLLVGPPGCGKSEVVSALRGAPAVWPLSSLTPQTLLSGYERKSKDAKKPASLLLQIGQFGIVTFKDLTTVLSMHHEAKSQIVSQLREVADGRTEKAFGNGLLQEWEGKLGLIAGVTPIIDEQHAFVAVMGERFVLYRMPEVTRPEIARRSLARRGREDDLRERIVSLVASFLSEYRDVGYLELSDRFTEPLIALADIVTRARSGVARDWKTRDILYLPEPEAPTRFAKQIAQLMAAAIRIGVSEDRAWRLARKVGWDSVPAVRSAVIHLLSRQEGSSLTYAELEEKTGLPKTTVRRVVEDLVVLGLAVQRKEGDAANARWLITESRLARDYWDSGDVPTDGGITS
jgi:uncharacterized membrane protein